MRNKRCCIDRVLPSELAKKGRNPRGVAVASKLWENGKTLRVKFLEGTVAEQDFVKRVAVKWSEYANLKFEFTNDIDAEIRITFDDNDGAWSAVGTDSLQAPFSQPTMNLGWLDEAVVLHEFGHAIGLAHEHQNPIGGIQWNKPVVYAELAGAPNFWPPEVVDHNLFDKYDQDLIIGTELDPLSIMMYPIDQSWTLDDFSTDFNPDLSDVDKAFMGEVYPFDGSGGGSDDGDGEVPTGELAVSVFSQYEAEIKNGGDIHKLAFTVTNQGRYIIETTGNTDMYLILLGPDDDTKVIETDDDSGESRNSKITRDLNPGKYFLQVRHYDDRRGTGPYSISIVTARQIGITPDLLGSQDLA